MRSWLCLAGVLWSANAAAEPAFTAAPLAGALEMCAGEAIRLTKGNFVASERLGVFGEIKELGPVPVGMPPSGPQLTSNEINDVMFANKGAIRSCYQKQLEKTKDLSGKVVVSFKIDANGAVAGATIKSTTLKSPPVEACILGEIRKLQFPAKAVALVTYPFIFSRG